MKWIEAIGAPGVGKSYLLHRLVELSEAEGITRNWLSEEESLDRAIVRIQYKNCHSLFQILLLLYSKQNFITYKRKGVRAVLVKKMFSIGRNNEDPGKWENYFDLHLKGISKSEYTDSIKDFINDNYLRLVSRFQFYERLALDKAIYVDEGLLQNNFGINDPGIELNEKPVLVIHYSEDVETIFRRVKAKENIKGKRCAWYIGLEDRELQDHIRKVLIIQREKINLLKNFQVPVIEIDSDAVNNRKKLADVLAKINAYLKVS